MELLEVMLRTEGRPNADRIPAGARRRIPYKAGAIPGPGLAEPYLRL